MIQISSRHDVTWDKAIWVIVWLPTKMAMVENGLQVQKKKT